MEVYDTHKKKAHVCMVLDGPTTSMSDQFDELTELIVGEEHIPVEVLVQIIS